MLFQTSWLPDLVARAYALRPVQWIWQWADTNVFLTGKMAAEPGPYRSSKTPMTRRLQYLAQDPFHNGRRIRKIVVKKSSQSGFTEAVLNCIRFFAQNAPRNVIYAIDSREEATNIQERLVPTLEALGEQVMPTDDDDMGKYKLNLMHMIIWFLGSFSAGKFANKQAPFCVSDEAEEHAKLAGDTTTVENLDSRLKNAEEGLHVVLSKPKIEVVKDGKITGGIICAEYAAGNQEIYVVPCPFCGSYQEIEWGRIKFDHCRDVLGEWDLDRVLNETCLECLDCKKLIPESHKAEMINNPQSLIPPMFGWRPTNEASDPEVVSQHMSDLYSFSSSVSWGRLAIKFIQSKGNRSLRQAFYNHNLGLGWKDSAVRTADIDILKLRSPYKRGEIPFAPVALLLGSDIGKSNAKWVVGAFNEAGDCSVIDWGDEIHPDSIAEIVNTKSYLCRSDGKSYKISQAGIDAKFRKEDSYAACMRAPLRLWPVMGGGGRTARLSFALSEIPTYPKWLRLISFNDRDAKTDLYTVRIKREVMPGLDELETEAELARMPRLLVPENVDRSLIAELVNEELQEDPDTGKMEWVRKGPNHYGDCIKVVGVLWRYLTRNRTPAITAAAATSPAEEPVPTL